MKIDDPTGPAVDRWLRSKDSETELALRYSLRGRFQKAMASPAFNARIDELFALLNPDEDELAAIVRHARHIRQAIDGKIGPRADDA